VAPVKKTLIARRQAAKTSAGAVTRRMRGKTKKAYQ